MAEAATSPAATHCIQQVYRKRNFLFPSAVCRTRKFVAVLRRARNWTVSWARLVLSLRIPIQGFSNGMWISCCVLEVGPNFYPTAAIMRSSLFWVITSRVLLVVYRRFGTSYRPHILESRSIFLKFLTLEKTPLYNYQRTLLNLSEQWRLYLHLDGSLKSRSSHNPLVAN
jgi:hypothetical protein